MKNGFRQSMAWLHTWTGLVVGWILFFVFVTGNLGRFDTEIDQWMKPEVIPQAVPLAQEINAAQQRLTQQAAVAERWTIYPTSNRDTPYLRITWDTQVQPGQALKRGEEFIDPATAAPLDTRATGGGQLLYKMHYALAYMPRSVSNWVIGICSMFMLVAIVSGVITHKKIFTDFFTFRPNKGQRSWLDIHAVLAVLTLPFFFMITYTGLLFFLSTLVPGIVGVNYGFGEKNRQQFNDELAARIEYQQEPAHISAPLIALEKIAAEAERRWGEGQVRSIEVSFPGDQHAQALITRQITSPLRSTDELVFNATNGELMSERPATTAAPRTFYETVQGLHESLFAGWWLRWLYFLSGLAGAAIIGSGLILWIVKRRPKQLKQAGGPDFGHRLVEGLNVGTIAGLHIAIAAYFYANRLLPAELAARNEWEVHVMFIVWLLALLHPILRPINRAWVEQLWVAAAAFLFLPVVHALTTVRGLVHSLQQGDWVFVGFDFVSLASALLFALAARKLHQREHQLALPEKAKPAKTKIDHLEQEASA